MPVLTLAERRAMVGDLVFSVSSAKRSSLGNNSRQYEMGQILEFDDGQPNSIDPMLVNPITETRHDTNVLDSSSMGLTEEDLAVIASSSLTASAVLTASLNSIKQQRSDKEQIVLTKQKTINELTKTISALSVMFSQTSDAAIGNLIDKLQANKETAIVIRDTATNDANSLAARADEIVSQLRAVAVVVK